MSAMSEYYRALKRGEKPDLLKVQSPAAIGIFVHRAGSEWCVTRVPLLKSLAPAPSYFSTERDAKAHARRLGNTYGEPVSKGQDLPQRDASTGRIADEEMF